MVIWRLGSTALNLKASISHFSIQLQTSTSSPKELKSSKSNSSPTTIRERILLPKLQDASRATLNLNKLKEHCFLFRFNTCSHHVIQGKVTDSFNVFNNHDMPFLNVCNNCDTLFLNVCRVVCYVFRVGAEPRHCCNVGGHCERAESLVNSRCRKMAAARITFLEKNICGEGGQCLRVWGGGCLLSVILATPI